MGSPFPTGRPLTEPDILEALTKYGADNARFVSQNPKLLKATFDLLKAVQSGDPIGGTSAIAGATSAGSKTVHADAQFQSATKATSLTVSTFKTTMDMMKVFKLTSPGEVMVYVGAATVYKTGMAVSLAGGDSERAKCIGAVMEVAGSLATSAIVVPTGLLLVLSIFSLAASSHNAYLACGGQ